jgi:hypothetical protein
MKKRNMVYPDEMVKVTGDMWGQAEITRGMLALILYWTRPL